MASSNIPAGWGVNTEDGNGATPSSSGSTSGVWDMDMTINQQTAILCANLPFYSQARPLQGTKAARESLLKLVTGMNNDVCPLNFRDETEKDNVTPDPYFGPAPGWTTLSGGRKPFITAKPADIAAKLTRAAACVPMVRSTPLFVVDAQANKRQVTLEELEALNIEVQPVPNLYKRAAAAQAAAGASAAVSATATAPSIDVANVLNRQSDLEKKLESITAIIEQVAATSAATMAAVRVAAAPPAPPVNPVPPVTPADAASTADGVEASAASTPSTAKAAGKKRARAA